MTVTTSLVCVSSKAACKALCSASVHNLPPKHRPGLTLINTVGRAQAKGDTAPLTPFTNRCSTTDLKNKIK